MPSDVPVRVLLADDDALVRDGLAMVLEHAGGIEVTAKAENGTRAIEAIKRRVPDVVLLDIRMPDMDGLECCRRIKELYPAVPVVMLTTFQDDDYLARALESGAHGYLLKHQSPEAVVLAIRNAVAGNASFAPAVAQSLRAPRREQTATRVAGLSARERNVLELVAEGLSNQEIAARIHLSEGTVRNYVSVLLQHAGVRDRTQLVVWYLRGRGSAET